MFSPFSRVGLVALRRSTVGLIAGVLAMAAVTLPSLGTPGLVSAFAHDQVISVSPADGTKVAKAPDAVRIRFSAALIEIGTEVRVLGPGGSVLEVPEATVNQEIVEQKLPEGLPPGQYTLAWRVVSSDGHPISGTTRFTVIEPAGQSPTPTSSTPASAAPTASPTASSASVPTTTSPATGSAATDESSSGTNALWWLLGAGALAAAGGLLALRRRR